MCQLGISCSIVMSIVYVENAIRSECGLISTQKGLKRSVKVSFLGSKICSPKIIFVIISTEMIKKKTVILLQIFVQMLFLEVFFFYNKLF